MSTFNDLLFELRCWDTDRLRGERERVIVERRKLRTRELALTRVLDERDALAQDQAARDGESESESRRKRATAKKLEHLPNLGNAAMNGELSSGQLDPAADLADEDSDEEITERAKGASPVELQKLARVFDQVTEKMRPAAGEAWEPLDRRQADVLIELCRMESAAGDGRSEEDRATEVTLAARVDVHVDIPMDGTATMCGQALPDEWVEAARANARIHLRVVDERGFPIAEDRARSFVSDKRRRAVIRRDGRCRWPGCGRRLRLQVHHLEPSSWGGGDDVGNLAAVCPQHHQLLIPHGDYVLEGNPNQPDGLRLRTLDASERGERRRRARAPAA